MWRPIFKTSILFCDVHFTLGKKQIPKTHALNNIHFGSIHRVFYMISVFARFHVFDHKKAQTMKHGPDLGTHVSKSGSQTQNLGQFHTECDVDMFFKSCLHGSAFCTGSGVPKTLARWITVRNVTELFLFYFFSFPSFRIPRNPSKNVQQFPLQLRL